MAFRRCISSRATVLNRRFNPSCSHILHTNNDDETESRPPNFSQSQSPIHKLLCRSSPKAISGLGSSLSRERRSSLFSMPIGVGLPFSRFMSSSTGEESERIEDVGSVAEVVTERTVDALASQPPGLSEVAIAAADSSYPVAALQYLIDTVHSFTGLNWWAAIALTTLLIRGSTIPFLINQLKATSKFNLIMPRLEELRQEMQVKAMDPEAVAEGQKRIKALFDEYGVTPFTPLKGLLIQGPIFISFFLAIRNMAEKVPSFKSGGALWFVDLTTPDSLFILPVLTALTFWITVECNMQEGLEGNPVADTMKKFSRILAAVSIPIMVTFPKALFCYWFTSNLFSLVYGLVIRRPEVKKLLGLPDIQASAETSSQPVIRRPEVKKLLGLPDIQASAETSSQPVFDAEKGTLDNESDRDKYFFFSSQPETSRKTSEGRKEKQEKNSNS